MKTYIINFHTGAGDIEDSFESLEQAMETADRNAEYTGHKITIETESGETVAQRSWYGVAYDEESGECEAPITFGTFGFYADWERF